MPYQIQALGLCVDTTYIQHKGSLFWIQVDSKRSKYWQPMYRLHGFKLKDYPTVLYWALPLLFFVVQAFILGSPVQPSKSLGVFFFWPAKTIFNGTLALASHKGTIYENYQKKNMMTFQNPRHLGLVSKTLVSILAQVEFVY